MDFSAAGNSPSWNISGLVYLPNALITFSGAVGKATNGNNCFVMVVRQHHHQRHRQHLQSGWMRCAGPDAAEQSDRHSRPAGGLACASFHSACGSLLKETSGLATIEFAFASTVLMYGLLNGLEAARYSFQKMEVANAVHAAAHAAWNACDTQAFAGQDQMHRPDRGYYERIQSDVAGLWRHVDVGL